MVLLQEYGNPVHLEGDTTTLATAFKRADEQWSDRLGADSIFDIQLHENGIQLRAKGVLGQVSVQGHTIEIAPKYIPKTALEDWRGTVFDILQFSQPDTFEFTGSASGMLAENSFADMLARGFVNTLEPALDRGVPTDYERVQRQSDTLEGELLINRLYPQILTDPGKLWVETSQLTTNTVLGRTLRFAARRFAALTTVPELRGRLQNIDDYLSGVDPTPPSAATLDRYFVPPQYRPFKSAFDIAVWLIRGRGAGLGGEETAVEGVLLKSHSIYQTFVHKSLGHISRERDWNLDEEPSIAIAEGPTAVTAYPDHVLKADTTTIILDSKYKGSAPLETPGRARVREPNANDTYQVAMAGRAAEATTVGLIYPADTPDDCWTLSAPGTPERLYTLTVDPIEFHQDRESFFENLTADLWGLINNESTASDDSA